MPSAEDIVSHEDIRVSGAQSEAQQRLLPMIWRFVGRRARRTGRAGPTSPAKRRMGSPVKAEEAPDFHDLESSPSRKRQRDSAATPMVKPEPSPPKTVSEPPSAFVPESPTKRPSKRGRPRKVKAEPTENLDDYAPASRSPSPLRPRKLMRDELGPEQEGEPGFVTANSSPVKSSHVFSSPAKSPTKPVLKQSPFKIQLNRHFVPTPIPQEGEYKPPKEKHLTYFFDGFEGYIDQKKPLRSHQKSTNTMAMAPQVTREEFSLISNTLNSLLHRASKEALQQVQRQMFPQYWFELAQGFSLLFYGVGSKRSFLEEFTIDYLSPRLTLSDALNFGSMEEKPDRVGGKDECDSNDESVDNDEEDDDEEEINGVPCVVINGYNPTCSYRDAFHSISQVMLQEELGKSETKYWGNHVELQINKMIEVYRDSPPLIKLVVLVHNLDGPMVRKAPFQNMLSSLARIRQIALIASTDHVYAPLLWDHVRAQNFNFIFHDITNYQGYAVESSFSDIMQLGKSSGTTGAEGARYVLDSLTSNSKRMYKLLIETQLANMESQGKASANKRGSHAFGIEFKQFYHLCAAEFIASNEVSLRSMLGEFIEHKMAAMSKDRSGAETLYVPYVYSEMQTLLKDVLNV
ncbi:LAQU0S03e05534g1_1 [Lachancea quebecensis]|uniref:Origin recognition complex subunit 2 n=1 Tax=Lachancea quebecensis TaxID=1654605 RepID=A0A0P1KP40_9SACH|nr:LAQU0S03e05534g1_1 [Lachancea quebecensis]